MNKLNRKPRNLDMYKAILTLNSCRDRRIQRNDKPR